MTEPLDRQLPQDRDFERAVLGSMLISTSAFDRAGMLSVGDFAYAPHAKVFRAMAAIRSRNLPIEAIIVKAELEDVGELESVGGFAFITSLVDGIPDVGNIERYAERVREKARLREIIHACNGAIHQAIAAEESPDVISAQLNSRLQHVTATDRESRPMYDVVLDVERRAMKRAEEGRTRAIATSFPSLDYHRVLRRKALIIVGAPTSHGKSTFMLNLATGAVTSDRSIAAVDYSLEMSDEDVTEPVLSMLSGVRLQNIQDRCLDGWEERKVGEALDTLKSLRAKLFFADRLREIDAIAADCHKRKATSGLDVVLVDYAQLVRGFDDSRNRENEVDRIARHLLLLSQELDCAVVAGSQVNKDREKRASGRLSVLDLKYGSVIGEHARVVLLFQRPRQDEKSNSEIPWCKTIFQIEKNSGRKTGDVPMHADLAIQRFAEGTCSENQCRYTGKNQPTEERELFA